MKYTYLIWDWNGTLLDDVQTNLDTANDMLARRKLPLIPDRETYRRVFSFPVIDFYKKVGFDLQRESFADTAEEYVETYRKNSPKSRLFGDVTRVTEELNRMGVRQAILSATEHHRLGREVASYGVYEAFEEILGVGDNLGNSKTLRGRAFVETLAGERVLFVGDTAHDAEVAKECDCDCVLICRGHMDRSRLEETGLAVYDSIGEFFEEIWGGM